jgi:hypothetical protein
MPPRLQPPSREIPEIVPRHDARTFFSQGFGGGNPRFFFQDAAQRDSQGVDAAKANNIGFGFMGHTRSLFGRGDRIVAAGDQLARNDENRPRWDYVLNQAFWAGGMAVGRTFELATVFDARAMNLFMEDRTITGDEMLMLWDAHYDFVFEDPDNPTRLTVKPTQQTVEMFNSGNLMLGDYNPNRMLSVYNKYYDGDPPNAQTREAIRQERSGKLQELGAYLVQKQQQAQYRYDQRRSQERRQGDGREFNKGAHRSNPMAPGRTPWS